MGVETMQILACADCLRSTTLNKGELGVVQSTTHIEVLIKLMSQAKWPLLTILNLRGIKLSPEAVTHLTKGKWQFLRTLYLLHCRLNMEACSAQQHAPWPVSETLLLAGNDIGAAHISCLVQARWPLLSHWDLCYNTLIQVVLAVGWPTLKHIVLRRNVLEMNALRYLSMGS